jgi:hypothetical protein
LVSQNQMGLVEIVERVGASLKDEAAELDKTAESDEA